MTKKTRMVLMGGTAFALLGIFFLRENNKVPKYEIFSVVQKDIVQNVLVTGKVQAAQSLDLSFESSGKITEANIKVGSEVKKGDILLRQNPADALASVRRASASVANANGSVSMYISNLESEKIKLEQLKNGTRSEEISLALASRDQAQLAFDDAKRSLENAKNKVVIDLENTYADVPETVQSAYTTAQTAFLEDLDNIFIDGSNYRQLNFSTQDTSKKTNIERERIIIARSMDEWRLRVFSVSNDFASKEILLKESKQYLTTLRNFLNNLSLCVDDSFDLSSEVQSQYRTSVNNAKASVNTAMSALVTQEQSIASQKINNTNALQLASAAVNAAQKSLDIAESQYQLKLSGPRSEEIADQETRVKQAEANLVSARARVSEAYAEYQSTESSYQKTILRSPIDGIISVLNAKVGEFFTASTPAVSVISRSDYEIKTNVSEIDIAKLKVGADAEVTLDAYGDSVIFKAQVAKIDPAETLLDGISTYTVTLQFLDKDSRVKSGMSANTKILIEKHENVLVIPVRALLTHDGKNFVKIQKNPKKVAEEIEVQIGLRGSDGMIEITKGLNGGQNIVVSEIGNKN